MNSNDGLGWLLMNFIGPAVLGLLLAEGAPARQGVENFREFFRKSFEHLLIPKPNAPEGASALSGVDLRPKSRTATGRRLQGSLVPISALRLRMCTRKVKENGRWREAWCEAWPEEPGPKWRR